jgi:hypothetical protein
MAWSWKDAAKGGGAGALTGAGIGAPFGGIGAGIGAGLGGLIGLISGGVSSPAQSAASGDDFQKWLFGTPEGQQSFSRFSPEQQQELSNLLKSGRAGLENPTKGFEPIRQNALNTFFKDVVPGLSHQFSASGSNSPNSGTLQSQLSGAGATLSSNLAAQEAQFGQNNQEHFLRQLQLGLSPQYGSGGMFEGRGTPGIAPRAFDLLFDQFQNYMANKNNPQQQKQPSVQQLQQGGSQVKPMDLKQAISPFTTQPLLQRNYNA